MGKDIQRPAHKRPSKRTPMLGQYHGKEHFPVLPSGFNPQQRMSTKSKDPAAGKQAPLIEQAKFPSGVLPSANTVVAVPSDIAGQVVALPSDTAGQASGPNSGLPDSSLPLPQDGSSSPSSNVEDNADNDDDEGIDEDD